LSSGRELDIELGAARAEFRACAFRALTSSSSYATREHPNELHQCQSHPTVRLGGRPIAEVEARELVAMSKAIEKHAPEGAKSKDGKTAWMHCQCCNFLEFSGDLKLRQTD